LRKQQAKQKTNAMDVASVFEAPQILVVLVARSVLGERSIPQWHELNPAQRLVDQTQVEIVVPGAAIDSGAIE
jgi:xanthine dehydrogenase molybdopterin-binding subunit B